MLSAYQQFNVPWFRVVSLQSQGGNEGALCFTGQTPRQKLLWSSGEEKGIHLLSGRVK